MLHALPPTRGVAAERQQLSPLQPGICSIGKLEVVGQTGALILKPEEKDKMNKREKL